MGKLARAWNNYENAQVNWAKFRDSSRFDDDFVIPDERRYWSERLDRLFLEGKPSAWDYQWWCASWMNHALHAWPKVNLVRNVGFNEEGTHTLGPTLFADMDIQPLGQIVHPDFILPCVQADSFAFYKRRSSVKYALCSRLGIAYPLLVAPYKAARHLRRISRAILRN